MIYWIAFIALMLSGCVKILMTQYKIEKRQKVVSGFSVCLSILTVLFLAMAREAYALTLVFLLFIIKGILLLKRIKADS